jgi:hypothetical protein
MQQVIYTTAIKDALLNTLRKIQTECAVKGLFQDSIMGWSSFYHPYSGFRSTKKTIYANRKDFFAVKRELDKEISLIKALQGQIDFSILGKDFSFINSENYYLVGFLFKKLLADPNLVNVHTKILESTNLSNNQSLQELKNDYKFLFKLPGFELLLQNKLFPYLLDDRTDLFYLPNEIEKNLKEITVEMLWNSLTEEHCLIYSQIYEKSPELLNNYLLEQMQKTLFKSEFVLCNLLRFKKELESQQHNNPTPFEQDKDYMVKQDNVIDNNVETKQPFIPQNKPVSASELLDKLKTTLSQQQSTQPVISNKQQEPRSVETNSAENKLRAMMAKL